MLAAVTGGLVAVAATTATAITTSAEQAADLAAHEQHANGAHDADTAELHDELAQVRRATARFHDLDAALAAGYELGWVNGGGMWIINGCVANVPNPAAGAMGYHYFNKDLMADLTVDPQRPEVLVYAPGADGERRLAAVEWVVRGPKSAPPGLSETDPAPELFGMSMHILNPMVGFYLMHAWIWQPNPAGMFMDWNPDVTCP
jgi:hypothetical protein